MKYARQAILFVAIGFVIGIAVAIVDWELQDGTSPMDALRSAIEYFEPFSMPSFGRMKIECGVPLPAFRIAYPDRERFHRDAQYRETYPAHPTIPVAYGLVLNTMVYGGAAWLLVVGLPAVWRWRRSKEGHCAKCGYDLTGLDGPCPECGADL